MGVIKMPQPLLLLNPGKGFQKKRSIFFPTLKNELNHFSLFFQRDFTKIRVDV